MVGGLYETSGCDRRVERTGYPTCGTTRICSGLAFRFATRESTDTHRYFFNRLIGFAMEPTISPGILQESKLTRELSLDLQLLFEHPGELMDALGERLASTIP